MARKRQYSDNDKATALVALDANKGNLNKTARELKLPLSTLKGWRDGHVHADVANIRTVKKGTLAERFDDATELMLDVLHKKLEDASLQQIATSIGILQDKSQLLKGHATERTEFTEKLTDDERTARVAALFERARARRTGQVD